MPQTVARVKASLKCGYEGSKAKATYSTSPKCSQKWKEENSFVAE